MTRLRAARFRLRRGFGGHLIAALVLTVAAGAVAVAMWGPPTIRPSREIRLVADGMAFYLESDPATPNPTLTVKPGERVRIILTNRDRGFTHDFAVPALSAALDAIDWNEDAGVVFEAPPTPGVYEYVCRPHSAMMKGQIIIGD
jgi:plastocyanin